MATNFISRGEADQAHAVQALQDMQTEVLYENRFGRQLWIRLYEGKKFVRRGEGKIFPDTERPIQNKRVKKSQAKTEAPKETQVNTEAQKPVRDLKAEYEAKFGKKVPNNKKNDPTWIESKL